MFISEERIQELVASGLTEEKAKDFLSKMEREIRLTIQHEKNQSKELRGFVIGTLLEDNQDKTDLGLTKVILLNLISSLILENKLGTSYEAHEIYSDLNSSVRERTSNTSVNELLKLFPRLVTWKMTDSKSKTSMKGNLTTIIESIDNQIKNYNDKNDNFLDVVVDTEEVEDEIDSDQKVISVKSRKK